MMNLILVKREGLRRQAAEVLFIQSGGDSLRREGAAGARGVPDLQGHQGGLRAVEDIGQGGLGGCACPSGLAPCGVSSQRAPLHIPPRPTPSQFPKHLQFPGLA